MFKKKKEEDYLYEERKKLAPALFNYYSKLEYKKIDDNVADVTGTIEKNKELIKFLKSKIDLESKNKSRVAYEYKKILQDKMEELKEMNKAGCIVLSLLRKKKRMYKQSRNKEGAKKQNGKESKSNN